MATNMSAAKIDVSDLIAVLTAKRRERFPFERHLSLMTFAAWMYYPNDVDLFRHAQTIAGARCLVETGKPNPFTKPEELSLALLAPPLETHLADLSSASENLANCATEIVSFFLCCPLERKPSLNKAFYFIENGGFDHPDFEYNDDDARSQSTLKIAWRERACTGPFFWSMAMAKIPHFAELLPNEVDAFKKVDKLVKTPARLLDYFGISKFVQGRLLSILDPESRRRFHVRFPNGVPPIEYEFTPFDQRQLKILDSYSTKAKLLGTRLDAT